MGRIEDTYKARDVEEIVDIYLYRPWGYALAVLAHRLRMTPNQVTLIGMAVGVLAGHFFYYQDLRLNLLGIFLWMLGQALDGADGQLARMADMRSRLGRMLDGISDNAKFTSLYLHLGLRLVAEAGTGWVFLIAAVAGITHSYQSTLADFYRNAYLFFVVNPQKAELEKSSALRREYARLRWSKHFFEKLLMRAYITYTTRQERWCGHSIALQRRARERFGTHFPDWLRRQYRALNKPLLKYYNALTTNTRMIVLYAAVLLGNLYVFFAFEILVLNTILLLLVFRWQKRADRQLAGALEQETPVATPA
ncbi:CDP-alcohol phosphatidyltransferase family protein [Rhodocaloribacter litoris]|uniref:CDP-alcohol phosphatidyltransferase family protein n=1 Tax=Rhodocaloribacter litoris TaxID=2558931 RepID=UPI001422A84C|nr:CDP-alcohol phosphatidyltransferase family protein [Rhodocaloribacter litoris]QXD14744.1 CDP-alcohol phosphatidyltransferase family protein [Rhodocaloribacter litoris]GIV59170.1 MAG: hypothetical protein KatS3mg043_0259 [Rhodothermaceae bacterium]